MTSEVSMVAGTQLLGLPTVVGYHGSKCSAQHVHLDPSSSKTAASLQRCGVPDWTHSLRCHTAVEQHDRVGQHLNVVDWMNMVTSEACAYVCSHDGQGV